MHEVRSHGLRPVQSVGLEIPLSPSVPNDAFVDVNETLRVWDKDIRQAARAVARAAGGSGDDAEDFAQVARILLARTVRRGLPDGESYRRRLIRNAVLGAARRERTGFRGLSVHREDMELVLVRARDDDSALMSRVADWVATLPSSLRDIYDILYVQGYTQREAAKQLDVSQSRVAQLNGDLKRLGREEFLAAA